MPRKGMWDVQNDSCPTTATLRALGEADRMIHNNNSCSLSDTSLVLGAVLKCFTHRGAKDRELCSQAAWVEIPLPAVCPQVSNFSLGLSLPICEMPQ